MGSILNPYFLTPAANLIFERFEAIDSGVLSFVQNLSIRLKLNRRLNDEEPIVQEHSGD
jgi:hypothetical protein